MKIYCKISRYLTWQTCPATVYTVETEEFYTENECLTCKKFTRKRY